MGNEGVSLSQVPQGGGVYGGRCLVYGVNIFPQKHQKANRMLIS
jgi:hypothetical protein